MPSQCTVVHRDEGWKTPDDTWMDMEDMEEEVFFINSLFAGRGTGLG
jgi:hypothetical protein